MKTELNLILVLAALLLFAVGYRWIRQGSPYSRAGGDKYAQKRRRKTLGQTFCAVAGLLVTLALINFFFERGPSAGPTPSLAAANAPVAPAPMVPTAPPEVATARPAGGPITADGAASGQAILDTSGDLSKAETPSTWAPTAGGNSATTNQPSMHPVLSR